MMQRLLVLLGVLVAACTAGVANSFAFAPAPGAGAGVSSSLASRSSLRTQRPQMPSSALAGPPAGRCSSRSSRTQLHSASLSGLAAGLVVSRPVAAAASRAVLKLLSSIGIGYGLSKKGILDQAALSSLSKLIFYVFQPCLLFVNVSAALAFPGQNFKKLMVLPAFALAQIAVASVFAVGVGRAFGIQPGSADEREARMCSTFANSGPLPLLFVDSLFGNHVDPTLLPSAVAFISFYLLSWSASFWTIGYSMLVGRPAPPGPADSGASVESTRKLGPIKSVVANVQRLKQSPTVRRIVSPPVMGSLLGMVVGLTPPLRSLFLGRSAILSPVFESLRALGSAYLPAAILVLAGSLARPGLAPKPAAAAAAAAGKGSSLLKWEPQTAKKLATIMAVRFLLMPVSALAMLMSGSRAGLIPYDKLLFFVLLMEGCMPPAQNSCVILSMEKDQEGAASMARTLLIVYALSAIPISCLLSVILQFVAL